MAAKVLLLNPFLTVYPDDPAGVSPPLGLAYLAGHLEKKGIEVAVLDIAAEGAETLKKFGHKIRYGLEEKEIIQRVKAFSPKIVGITCQSTLHLEDAHEVARIIRKIDKSFLVAMGGAYPSAEPKTVLRDKNVDVVVKGEGEITFYELICVIDKKRSLAEVKGIWWRDNGKVVENPPRERIKNLDMLPFPAYHLLPTEIYFAEIRKKANYLMRDRVAWMITSRGCPGNCVYCAVRTVWGRTWRGRSAKNVVDEMESLIKDYQVREIHFLDDSLSVDQRRLENICDEIIKRKFDIKWTTPNGVAVWLLDEKLIRKMKLSGCYRLTFGLESGNAKVLNNFVGKHYDYQYAREMISFCSKIGIWTVGTFIIGFPFESREQIEDTINFAISSDLDFAVFYIANPFPGTPMYDIYRREGLLPSTGLSKVVRGCRTKFFTHEELENIQQEAFSRFLASRLKKPWHFLNKIRSLEDLFYFLKLGKNLSKLVFNKKAIEKKGIAALWRK